jgi:predicted nucleotidyltransferase
MEKIIASLKSIEQEKKIQILYACETGSRAWGFASPDSDYDIRFLYMHDMDWYLSLDHRKDTIEVMTKDDFDITGWDLRKALILLKKSNVPLIERFQSPVEYLSEPGIKEDFKNLIVSYYSPTAVFYHHHSLARKFWEDIVNKQEVKLKSYFYLLRSMLSCNWIIQNKTVLPMHIEGLMTLIDEKVTDKLRSLIELKAGVGEKYLHTVDRGLNEWILELWRFIDNSKDRLDINNTKSDLLNEFFLKIIYAGANNRLGKG